MRRDEAVRAAAGVQALAAAFDQTVSAGSEVVITAWADMLQPTDWTPEELRAAVLRVYRDGGEVPRNKIGAILHAAREVRREARKSAREAAENALPAPPTTGWTGRPVEGAYRAHGAVNRPCPTCGVIPGRPCRGQDGPLRMPHFARLRKPGVAPIGGGGLRKH